MGMQRDHPWPCGGRRLGGKKQKTAGAAGGSLSRGGPEACRWDHADSEQRCQGRFQKLKSDYRHGMPRGTAAWLGTPEGTVTSCTRCLAPVMKLCFGNLRPKTPGLGATQQPEGPQDPTLTEECRWLGRAGSSWGKGQSSRHLSSPPLYPGAGTRATVQVDSNSTGALLLNGAEGTKTLPPPGTPLEWGWGCCTASRNALAHPSQVRFSPGTPGVGKPSQLYSIYFPFAVLQNWLHLFSKGFSWDQGPSKHDSRCWSFGEVALRAPRDPAERLAEGE